jgi:hypothetical protein
MNIIKHVFVVMEIDESAEERPVIHGIFTDLYMAMTVFNTAVGGYTHPYSKQYFSGRDVAHVEVTDGPRRGLCWVVERIPVTTRPDMRLTEGPGFTFGVHSGAALEAMDKAGIL